ncbi:hypothetical protein [Mesorhizobium sp. NZP2077]|uniref:hypothetical protein n=1 Tax=Mesorhizobium sp. NZP2077 TaxID=2483404 RepID=UPI0015558328|nr:hypothetical protein [Mesorhizobium sp. NZP2077]QKC85214.1 hypothetical protein EB232_29860 [Mesorhizobium sp. NZP2077]QKD18850.1 hypothetical protein HGP13_29550 [Mesorhizobium sp. NZP2077]
MISAANLANKPVPETRSDLAAFWTRTPDFLSTALIAAAMAWARRMAKPGLPNMLGASSLVALVVAMALPFTPLGRGFGFEAPFVPMLAGIGVILIPYLVSTELLRPLAVGPASRADQTHARPIHS